MRENSIRTIVDPVSDTGACYLKEGCTDVICLSDKIIGKFSPDLFGQDVNLERIEPKPTIDVEEGSLGYKIECALGECGMQTKLTDETVFFDLQMKMLAKQLNMTSFIVMTQQFTGKQLEFNQ